MVAALGDMFGEDFRQKWNIQSSSTKANMFQVKAYDFSLAQLG